MSTFRNPVGPQPSSVYWRRRIVFGLVIIAVVTVILLIVFRPGSGETVPVGSETPGPDSSESDAPDPGGSDAPEPGESTPTDAGEAVACSPSAVRVTPVVNADQFAAGEEPELSMEIVNIGAAACSFDVGTGQMEFLIMSGTDRIWSSTDCQSEPTEQLMVLEPNQTLTTDPPLVWDRSRSSADTCTGDRPEVVAGGSTYRLSATLGEASSADDVPFLLY